MRGLIIDRLINLDLCRSVARAVPLDAESESFERVATPIAGLPELMDKFGSRLSAGTRIPVTLLMGVSPKGLNATGASDITFFYDHISAAQEAKHRTPYERMIELIFSSAEGPDEPENWSLEFNPLWQMSEKESAEVRKLQSETDSNYITNRVLDESEVAQSRFGGDAYSTETTLDPELRDEEKDDDPEIGGDDGEEET